MFCLAGRKLLVAYTHACPSRWQQEHAGASAVHLIFFFLWEDQRVGQMLRTTGLLRRTDKARMLDDCFVPCFEPYLPLLPQFVQVIQ